MDSGTSSRRKTPGGFLLLGATVLVIILPDSLAVDVTWKQSQSWESPNNWADDYVPRNGSHVVFPVEMRLSVGLPVKINPLEFAGIELPRDGILALPATGRLKIIEAQTSTKSARWLRQGPLLWVDPDNWDSVKSNAAVPHLERIPCQQDVAVLPAKDQIFSIKLPDIPGVKVASVRVSSESVGLLSRQWWHFRSSREFAAGPMSIEYSGVQGISDVSCQSEQYGREFLAEICATPGAKCQTQDCKYPISVEGNCCSYCGGRLVVSNKSTLSLVRRMAEQVMPSYESTLSWHVRRTWSSETEVLIAGKKGYAMGKTIEALADLKNVLEEQGIKIIRSEMTGTELSGSQAAAVIGTLLGMLGVVIMLLLLAFPYFGYSLPRVLGEGWNGLRTLRTSGSKDVATTGGVATLPRKAFKFARFENAKEADAVELDSSSAGIGGVGSVLENGDDDYDYEDDNEGGGGGGGRFANPLYSSKRRVVPEGQSFAALQKSHEDSVDEEVDLSIDT